MRTVVGLFESGNEARRAIDELAQLGFSPQNISVITNLSTKSEIEAGNRSADFQKMNLTDVGAVAASGPLAAQERPGERAGLGGMLERLGLSSDLAAHFVSGVERGETLESMTVDDADAERVAAVMKKRRAAAPAAGAAAGTIGGAAAAKLESERMSEKRDAAKLESERMAEKRDAAKLESERIGEKNGEGRAAGGIGQAVERIREKRDEVREKREEKRDEAAASKLGEKRDEGRPAGTIGQAVASKLEPERIGEKHTDGHAFAEEERTVPVYREELSVGKREVERGGVRLTTHVVEKPYAEQILLREEHVEVERRPADRLMRPEESQFKESQIEMAEIGEEAVGAKQTRLVEEVVIHKHVGERTATVGDTLRSTEIDVRSFDPSIYRSHFEQQKRGETFEEHLAAYRFGEGVGRPGSRWEEVEKDARSRWEAAHPGTWDRFSDSIRYAWSRSGERR